MRKTKISLVSGALAIAIMLLNGCSANSAEQPKASASDGAGLKCEPATLAGLDDDSHRAAFYGLANGKVTSTAIPSVKISYLQIPALIQATGTGQFTYTMTSLPGVVRANKAGGLDLRIVALSLAHTGGGMALYAKKESGIKSGADLKGKRVAVASLGSTAIQEAQFVFTEKYGLAFRQEGGDIRWVELDPATELNALQKGDIDAAVLWHQAAWLADKDPTLVKVDKLDTEYKAISGAWPIGAAFVAQGKFVDANLKCVNEFQRMLEASVKYAQDNVASFAGELSKETGVSADFIKYWWDPANYEFGGVVDSTWVGYAKAYYDLAFKYKAIPVDPDLSKLIVARG